MKLELHFSEQEMRDFLKQHWWLSMEIATYEIANTSHNGTDTIPCTVEVFWKGGIRQDTEPWEDKPKDFFDDYSLEASFLKEMKSKLLKL